MGIYNGRVDVPIECLNSFLTASQLLDLKGVALNTGDNSEESMCKQRRSDIESTSANIIEICKAHLEALPSASQKGCLNEPIVLPSMQLSKDAPFLPVHSTLNTSEYQMLKDLDDTITGIITKIEPSLFS